MVGNAYTVRDGALDCDHAGARRRFECWLDTGVTCVLWTFPKWIPG